ncbi:TolC family protein [Flavobacterium sp. SUN046]|uniref:TolC family protein n=1 Tax=Flavobacterium sp. SUN046 TaxID=3002440 RepID=UPI002DB66B37|nr:TolC family protein [Flavobacterium sp. SUN046]MEC4050497.1 TolC family protein [Flavobacterium sp. SUN046]
MKTKSLVLFIFLSFGTYKNYAQDKKILTLKEAVELAVNNSNQSALANAKVESAKLDLENTKNNQYPSLKVSGQYMRLTNANISSKLNFGSSSSGQSAPLKVEQLMIGQANVSMPVFSGFKLKNSIKASSTMYKAETFTAAHTKEQLGLEVVDLFANLYKAQEMTALIEENLKSAEQRAKDFASMEQNGIIARNDLLKAQLQVSNIQLALDNSKKNTAIVNYQLVNLLKLAENTQIAINIEAIKEEMKKTQSESINGSRNDLQSLQLKQEASETGIKIAKANYYPSLALTGGYIAFDLKNVLAVNNAMNFGLGVSYDLSSIFKNNKQVKLATSRANETKQAVAILTDQIKEEIQQAQENYNLSLKQSLVYDKAFEQATENYRIIKDKYDNSLSTTNDLLEADVEQLQAKINQALCKADVAQKYYELQFASGKLIKSLNITIN